MKRLDIVWTVIATALLLGIIALFSDTVADHHMQDVCQSLKADLVGDQCVRDGRVVKVFR